MIDGWKYIILELNGTTPRFMLANQTIWESTQSNFGIAANTWAHVVGVYDQNNNVLKIYVNGVER